jgi:uncharacterized protein (TIGR02246 family)
METDITIVLLGVIVAIAIALLGMLTYVTIATATRDGGSGSASEADQGMILTSSDPASLQGKSSNLNPVVPSETVQEQVLNAFLLWMRTVTSHRENAPQEVAALYAKRAVLLGTVSEELRGTPGDIEKYFEYFARKPDLQVLDYSYYIEDLGRGYALNAGTYLFFSRDEEGHPQCTYARYSFLYRKTTDGTWKILEHHSSEIPHQPSHLAAVDVDLDHSNPDDVHDWHPVANDGSTGSTFLTQCRPPCPCNS